MITDGHMQYLFDEKGKRYAEKEGFLFRFSFFLRRRRRRRRSTSSSLMNLPPSFFFHSTPFSTSATSTPSPGSSPSRSATATRGSSRPSRISR